MFNVLICLKQLDNINLAPMLERLYNHTKPQQIHIITSSNNANLILNLSQNIQEKIYIFDEDKIYKNLSLEVIQKYMESKNAAIWRSGWYLQQFLKMGYATFANSNDKTSNALLDMGGGGVIVALFLLHIILFGTQIVLL
ncbi:hypothetical protein [Helicobacter bilis]|uniref:hypothetical protein n=1 Tax=Helicobacter bilis TaxID=37372 RepID=UPI0025A98EA6|nr:hypothetical protein [Helicobacter bilis]